jgi:hypothetical protein
MYSNKNSTELAWQLLSEWCDAEMGATAYAAPLTPGFEVQPVLVTKAAAIALTPDFPVIVLT